MYIIESFPLCFVLSIDKTLQNITNLRVSLISSVYRFPDRWYACECCFNYVQTLEALSSSSRQGYISFFYIMI